MASINQECCDPTGTCRHFVTLENGSQICLSGVMAYAFCVRHWIDCGEHLMKFKEVFEKDSGYYNKILTSVLEDINEIYYKSKFVRSQNEVSKVPSS